MSTETTYAELDNGQIKVDGTEIKVTQDSGKTTVEVKDGTPGQGDEETEEFDIDDAKLTAAKREAEGDNGYDGLSGDDKKDAIINKYIAIVSDVNSKNHPKTDEDKDKIRTSLGIVAGGKAKRSKKSAKKGKKSRGMKGKRGRRSAKKGRK